MRFFLLIAVLFSSATGWGATPAQSEVVVIGAGLSGLATAYELKKQGIAYHVLEITPRVGGRVRTVRYNIDEEEVYADSGMEEYWESNPAVKILEELKLPVRSDVAISSIVVRKKLHKLGDEDRPQFLKKVLKPDGYKALGAFQKKLEPMMAEIKSGKISPATMKLKDVAFSDWVKKQGLPRQLADWIRVSVECEIGTEWSKLSALDGIAEFHIFMGEGEKSYRVIGGNEKFTDALAKAVGVGNISLNKKVNRIVTGNDGVVSVYYLDMHTNESSVVRAKHVVSTIPLYRIPIDVQFEPPLSPKKLAAIQSQSWGAYFKAHIFLKPEAEKFWIKGDTSMLPILSDSELGVVYDANPDQKSKTRIVSLLVHGAQAEAFNMMPLDIVRNTISKGVDRLWPGISKHVKGMEFYRLHPRAIAGWPVGRSRFDELSNEMRRPENGVYFAGDFTESTHSDGAFLSATRVVRQINDARNGVKNSKFAN